MKKINRSILVVYLFVAGCTNHQHHDFYNTSASRIDVGDPGFNPLEGNVITTFINVRDTTLSTLYGNDPATHHAGEQTPYTDGDVLTLVTWKQQRDPYWFGGNIPDNVVAVEIVRFKSGEPVYTIHTHEPVASNDETTRIKFITEAPPSEFP